MPEIPSQMQSGARGWRASAEALTCHDRCVNPCCARQGIRLQSDPAARYRTAISNQIGAQCASLSMVMQVISVVGALMVLIAYGLIQAGTWRELDAGYLTLNIVGSLLLGIVAIEDRRVGFVLLEFAWAGIGLVGVARSIRARRTARGL